MCERRRLQQKSKESRGQPLVQGDRQPEKGGKGSAHSRRRVMLDSCSPWSARVCMRMGMCDTIRPIRVT